MGIIRHIRSSYLASRLYERKSLLPAMSHIDKKFLTTKSSDNETSSQKNGKVSGVNNPANKFDNIVVNATKSAAIAVFEFLRHPSLIPRKIGHAWQEVKDVAKHYWLGSKLLVSDVRSAKKILSRVLHGHALSRRERLQLVRTTNDIFRLVPFAIFVIVPFMEFLLPFALKFFPNMLPSTFQDSLKKEELMKQELQMRLAVADFMRETLQSMAQRKRSDAFSKDMAVEAKEVINFMEQAKQGAPMPKELVLRVARLFKDELTLPNVPHEQLIMMCRYMGLQAYGGDSFLRFQLRTKLNRIKEDDRRILWDGLDSLTKEELQEACRERGMRSIGLTAYGYKLQMREWLDLSIQKSVPISLLIISRSLNLNATDPKVKPPGPEDILRDSLSSLNDDLVNEIIVEHAASTEENSPELRKRKLESLQFQEKMIENERANKAAAANAEAPENSKSESASIAAIKLAEKLRVVDEATSFPPVSKSTKTTDGGSSRKKISLAEMQALGDMVMGSSVEREKLELAKLKAMLDVEGSSDRSRGVLLKDRINPTDKSIQDHESGSTPDKSTERLQGALNRMLNRLEVSIETTEKALGDKLNRLDKDRDGVVDSFELREVFSSVLKDQSNGQAVAELLQVIDQDRDGKVTVRELLAYIEERKKRRYSDHPEHEDIPSEDGVTSNK